MVLTHPKHGHLNHCQVWLKSNNMKSSSKPPTRVLLSHDCIFFTGYNPPFWIHQPFSTPPAPARASWSCSQRELQWSPNTCGKKMGTTTWLGFAPGNKQKIHMPFLIALLVDFTLGTSKNHLKLIGLGLAKHFLAYPLWNPMVNDHYPY